MRTYVAESVRPPTKITLRHGTMAPPLCATMLATCSAISLCSVAAIALPSMRLEGADMLAGKLASVRVCVRGGSEQKEGRNSAAASAECRALPSARHQYYYIQQRYSQRLTRGA